MAKVSRIITALITRPADCTTPEGRGQERYRRAALTTVVMISARVANILAAVLTVPVTLRYLGEDLFGVWMALTSVISFLSFYDFGIGTGLRNMLIECSAKHDLHSPRKLICNALLALTALAASMVLVVFIVLPHLPWGELIRCKNSTSVAHILPTAQAVLLMFALGLPITQLINIASAYQRGYWGYLCYLFGRMAGVAFVLWCVKAGQPLWLLAGGYVGIPFAVTLVGWCILFVSAPHLRPWPLSPDLATMRRLFTVGFFVLLHHLSVALINASGLLLIANTINATSGVPYAVTQQVLGVSSLVTGSLLVGLSVAVGEAWHREDHRWVEQTVRRMEKIVLLSGVAPLIVLLFACPVLVLWWTNSAAAVPSFSLLLACVLYSSASVIGEIYATSLIAMNFVRFISVTKFVAGIFVAGGGYLAGVASQSPAVIAMIQFSVGALIPAVLFWRKMREVIRQSKVPAIAPATPA